jgi:excinuclease ABC subunit C
MSVQRPPAGSIPTSPGSYQFKDDLGRVIYVGKASNLRQRLSNYFQDPAQLHPRTAAMVQTAQSVEWIEVRNEVEALILEHSLIKQHHPRFNVRLRDDKSYPFLAVTVDEDYPRAVVMRGTKRKGTRYLSTCLGDSRNIRSFASYFPGAYLQPRKVQPAQAAWAAMSVIPH